MAWTKGQTGNPKGRPAGSYTQKKLEAAIKRWERTHPGEGKVLDRYITMAMSEPSVMVSLMKKLIPDRKAIEAELKNTGRISVVVNLHREDGSVEELGADNSGDTNGDSN